MRLPALSLRLLLAGALTLIGVSVAWRSLSSQLPQRGAPAASAAPVPPSGPIPTRFDTQVTRDNVAGVVEQIAGRSRSLLAQTAPQVRDATAAVQALADELTTYFTADFDRYLEQATARDAYMPALTGEDQESSVARLRDFWTSGASTVAFRSLSPEEVQVRPRYIDGRAMPQPPLGREEVTTAPSRYGLSTDPERARLTIIEFVVPVMHQWEGTETPMWWGVWLTKHPTSGRWVPWRFSLYDPTHQGPLVGPSF